MISCPYIFTNGNSKVTQGLSFLIHLVKVVVGLKYVVECKRDNFNVLQWNGLQDQHLTVTSKSFHSDIQSNRTHFWELATDCSSWFAFDRKCHHRACVTITRDSFGSSVWSYQRRSTIVLTLSTVGRARWEVTFPPYPALRYFIPAIIKPRQHNPLRVIACHKTIPASTRAKKQDDHPLCRFDILC